MNYPIAPDEPCQHTWRHLRAIPRGHYRTETIPSTTRRWSVWDFDHVDDVFFCESCLQYQVKDFQPQMLKSIYSYNTKESDTPSEWKPY